MYESPIKLIFNDIETSLEDGIFKAVQRVGITVDKEELIKALQYDRDQYRQGFKDGITKANETWTMKWHEVMKLAPWSVDERREDGMGNDSPNR